MNTSNPINLLIAGIYYILVGIAAFFSIFSVYILIRYGRSRALCFSAAVIYILFFLSLLGQSHQTLLSLP